MATIASGTWDTPVKPRSKYKMFDTTPYQLITVYEVQVDQYMFRGNGGTDQIIQDWIHTEQGQYLIHKVKQPAAFVYTDHVMARNNCIVQAYITQEDLMMYKLAFGAEACM